MNGITVIESIGAKSTKWGISFSGPNPEAKDYFQVCCKADAFRLIDRLSARCEGLEREKASREALEKVKYILTNVYAPDILKVLEIARQALDQGPEVKEVTREELAEEIGQADSLWGVGDCTLNPDIKGFSYLAWIADHLLTKYRVERR